MYENSKGYLQGEFKCPSGFGTFSTALYAHHELGYSMYMYSSSSSNAFQHRSSQEEGEEGEDGLKAYDTSLNLDPYIICPLS
jgi:hypothetical protein